MIFFLPMDMDLVIKKPRPTGCTTDNTITTHQTHPMRTPIIYTIHIITSLIDCNNEFGF